MSAPAAAYPEAEVLADRIRDYCQTCAAEGAAPTREDVLLDVVEVALEVDRPRWLLAYGRDPERVPTIDGAVVWLLAGAPWAALEE